MRDGKPDGENPSRHDGKPDDENPSRHDGKHDDGESHPDYHDPGCEVEQVQREQQLQA